FSEQGHPCVLQSPFDGAGIQVTRADNRQPVTTAQDEEVFTFRTTAGVTYEITPAVGAPPPSDAPVITAHPASTTVVFPAEATFTVAATGTDVRYQWQKNRVNIPGATSPSYTTPPTTLWDLGSAYRCVVSNAFGTTRSQPGILNPNNQSPSPRKV
ncbi:MAG TPA: hypothetical protein PKM43_03865, partial [Verrucomicrobiota bacterium]|nr:hypothetical protein [Verrucomicrobiota bacterium]